MMLEQDIRNLIVTDNSGNTNIVNDRKILEYLLSYECREKILSKGLDGLFETRVNILDLTSVKSVERDMSADMAAKLLLDLNTHCLLLTSGSIGVSSFEAITTFRRSRIDKEVTTFCLTVTGTNANFVLLKISSAILSG